MAYYTVKMNAYTGEIGKHRTKEIHLPFVPFHGLGIQLPNGSEFVIDTLTWLPIENKFVASDSMSYDMDDEALDDSWIWEDAE